MSGGRVVYVDAGACTVSVSAASIPNDNATTATITVRCLDDRGNPMQRLAAANVVVSSTGTGNTIAALSGVTNQNGEISTTIRSSVAEAKTISATVLGEAVTDTASLPVIAGAWPYNEPVGYTEYGTTEFGDILNGEVLNAAGFTVSGTESGVASGDLRTDVNGTDVTAPGGDDDVYFYTYPGNDAGNGAGVPATAPSTGTLSRFYSEGASLSAKRMYVAFDVWFSPDYVTHTNREKLVYPIGSGGIATSIGIAIASGDDAYGEMRLNVQPQSSAGPQNTDQPSGPNITKGVWHTVEVLLTMNSGSSTTDGQMDYWLDGTLAWTLTGLNFGSAQANPVWDAYRIDGTRGGGASSVLTPAGGQTRRFARLAAFYSTTL
jgi:hypothetical protein